MIKRSDSYNRYNSAQDRFMKSALANFFAQEFPKLFGPVMREKLAEELLDLVANLYPENYQHLLLVERLPNDIYVQFESLSL